MIRRTNVHRRSRAKLLKPYIPRSHDTLLTVGGAALNIVIFTATERLTFARDNATGALIVPQYLVQSVAPIAIVAISANSFSVEWTAAVPTDTLEIPAQDPAVRNYTGGFMTQQTVVLA